MVFRRVCGNGNEENKSKNEQANILEVSKTLMYELWYGYIKSKYGEEAKLCYRYFYHLY